MAEPMTDYEVQNWGFKPELTPEGDEAKREQEAREALFQHKSQEIETALQAGRNNEALRQAVLSGSDAQRAEALRELRAGRPARGTAHLCKVARYFNVLGRVDRLGIVEIAGTPDATDNETMRPLEEPDSNAASAPLQHFLLMRGTKERGNSHG